MNTDYRQHSELGLSRGVFTNKSVTND